MAHAALQNVKEFKSKYSFYEFRRDYVFNISSELNFNTSRYNQIASGCDDFSQTEVKVEFVVPPSLMLIVCTGAVGGLLLLIIILFLLLKCGFFTPKRPEVYENRMVILINFSTTEN
ncbi:integrin alpha-E-like [Cyprinus carpio]|uniref:Integrin alpha-E-like n=1 Tax=Cyprinus carpio TaxID=7962 RepID=A0A9Q9ZTJ5_CYPCA|nr:integrin alpha-E-like [Cyprinus carpio]